MSFVEDEKTEPTQNESSSDTSDTESESPPIKTELMTEKEIDLALKIQKPKEVAKPVKTEVSKKYAPLKCELIDDILKISTEYSKRQLTRFKKDKLSEILAENFKESVEKVCNMPSEDHPEVMIQAMYSCLLGCATLLESGTKKFRHYTWDMVLHNYAETLDKERNRMVILDCLEIIYAKNKILISSYLSVETRLAFVFTVSAVQCLQKYESLENADGLQTGSNHRPTRCRENGINDLSNQEKKSVRRHVSPNHSYEQRSRDRRVPIPRKNPRAVETKQAVHLPGRDIPQRDHQSKPETFCKKQAFDKDVSDSRRFPIEERAELFGH